MLLMDSAALPAEMTGTMVAADRGANYSREVVWSGDQLTVAGLHMHTLLSDSCCMFYFPRLLHVIPVHLVGTAGQSSCACCPWTALPDAAQLDQLTPRAPSSSDSGHPLWGPAPAAAVVRLPATEHVPATAGWRKHCHDVSQMAGRLCTAGMQHGHNGGGCAPGHAG